MPRRPGAYLLAGALAIGAGMPGARADEAAAAGGSPPGGPAPSQQVLDRGREIFTELAAPNCGICHTLGDAGSAGEIGPNLDVHPPAQDADRVRLAVEQGVGNMPSFVDVLSAEQIEAVALYVAAVAGRAAK
jgi:mono/diheme cytochrome c family protein